MEKVYPAYAFPCSRGIGRRISKVGAVAYKSLWVLQGPVMGPEADTDETGSEYHTGPLTS